MHKIALTLAVFGLSATAAFAQAPTTFAELDGDANGELSITEIQVAWPDLGQDEFTTADADASGGLSTAELSTLQPAAGAPAAETLPAPTLAPSDSMAPADAAAPPKPSESLMQ
ncbi:hypothetical protein ABIB57_001766 [Devosia sp. UYZn731]|uniref:hypothetical protein n=1 Tax=Devosia sp. UYZn731 TaxID=3156345 RepID=UPI0033971691